MKTTKTDLELLQEVRDIFKYLYVPTSTINTVKRIPAKTLKTIHPNTDVSREVLYLLLSNFSKTFLISEKSDKGTSQAEGYVRLDSQVLKDMTRVGRRVTYAKGMGVLISEGLIEVGKDYSTTTNKCREYRLTPKYFNFKVTRILPKQDFTKKHLKKMEEFKLEGMLNNPIIMESLRTKERMSFPTVDEVKELLIEEAKKGHTNKRGMRLVYLNKRNKDNFENCVFVEDYLEMYKNSVDNPIIPTKLGEDAGGRVVTAYNMMPQIIRKHLKIDGEELVELDFTCLHPNIVNTLYGESPDTITHDMVAQHLGIDRKTAKIAHLSLFNMKWSDMVHNPLFDFYATKHTKMMERLFRDKEKYGYKHTSKILFRTETELMTTITQVFIAEGIPALYVFDALYVPKSKAEQAKIIMNNTAEVFNINTNVN